MDRSRTSVAIHSKSRTLTIRHTAYDPVGGSLPAPYIHVAM